VAARLFLVLRFLPAGRQPRCGHSAFSLSGGFVSVFLVLFFFLLAFLFNACWLKKDLKSKNIFFCMDLKTKIFLHLFLPPPPL
jgi:hypothetical protein